MENLKLWANGAPGYSPELGPEPDLTPFILENGKENGCIIVCPGGAYILRAEHEGSVISKKLNELGMSSFVLNYRVNPYHYPYITADVIRAVRYVRYNAKRFNIDPDRIGILGFSAGGHLAVSSAVIWNEPDILEGYQADDIDRVSARPDFQVLCYPVVSLAENTHELTRKVIVGDAADPDRLIKRLSGELNVTKDSPPAFIWSTANDPVVPVSNSVNYASELIKAGVPCELHIFPDGPHGLGLGIKDEKAGIQSDNDSVKQWMPLLKTFLVKYGFLR